MTKSHHKDTDAGTVADAATATATATATDTATDTDTDTGTGTPKSRRVASRAVLRSSS